MSVLVLDDDIQIHELSNVDNAMIKENNEVMDTLNSELEALKEIMILLGLQIADDGEALEAAAENTSEAKRETVKGVENLEQAHVYVKKNRNMKIGMAAGGIDQLD